jgi:translation initiation factor IF-1
VHQEGRTKTDPTEAGVVEEVLPSGMHRVRLSEGRVVRAGVDVAARGTLVKLIAGDRVEVRLVARDPSRGQIVRKL